METMKKIGRWITKSKLRVIVITLIAIFSAATIYAAAANSYTVQINVGDSTKKITTFRTDAYEILNQANIEIGDGDLVDLSDFSSNTNSVITVYKTCNVYVSDNGSESVMYTGVATVAKTLENNEITVGEDDALNFSADDPVYEGMEITVTRAFPVTISADGDIFRVNVAGGIISDALDKAVIAVDDDDIISQPLDTVLEPGMAIKVTRVSYTERSETVSVPFTTTTNKTSSLYVGQSKITQAGADGEKTITYKDKYVDGVLEESTAVNTVIIKDSVSEIKQIGTKSVATTPTTNAAGQKLASAVKTISVLKAPSSVTLNGNVPTSYRKKIVGTASAYSGGGRTATGKTVQNGYVAVNPNQIAYHTKMWIVSNDGNYVYGYASAEDTGGFVNWTGSRATLCDLYFSSESQASAFGRRSVTIYIL